MMVGKEYGIEINKDYVNQERQKICQPPSVRNKTIIFDALKD